MRHWSRGRICTFWGGMVAAWKVPFVGFLFAFFFRIGLHLGHSGQLEFSNCPFAYAPSLSCLWPRCKKIYFRLFCARLSEVTLCTFKTKCVVKLFKTDWIEDIMFKRRFFSWNRYEEQMVLQTNEGYTRAHSKTEMYRQLMLSRKIESQKAARSEWFAWNIKRISSRLGPLARSWWPKCNFLQISSRELVGFAMITDAVVTRGLEDGKHSMSWGLTFQWLWTRMLFLCYLY